MACLPYFPSTRHLPWIQCFIALSSLTWHQLDLPAYFPSTCHFGLPCRYKLFSHLAQLGLPTFSPFPYACHFCRYSILLVCLLSPGTSWACLRISLPPATLGFHADTNNFLTWHQAGLSTVFNSFCLLSPGTRRAVYTQ